MTFFSINPATEEKWGNYEEWTDEQIQEGLMKAQRAFEDWREVLFEQRGALLERAAEILRDKKRQFGEIMTKEMGKPINAAIAEAEKCALACEFYAERGEEFLASEIVETDASKSYVRYDPLGVILAVMPWNFPFWQAVRAIAPAVMAGNTMILKHASNVPMCGIALERLFLEAGFPVGVFQNFLIKSDKVESLIKDERVKAATLTGSEYAGSQVAMECGREIKKTVLELGGSDAFIVLEDANIEKAAQTAATARLINNGQSCIAAKRFIVVKSRAEEFLELFKKAVEAKVIGDPLDEKTEIGPLATKNILGDIERQVKESVAAGARLVTGGKRRAGKGYFFEPTILVDVKKGMTVYEEETFGPVAAVITVRDEAEAIKVANDSRFGLGASLWTADENKAHELARQIEAGAVFINGMVKSDPRLPFGGIKKSGYGRELGLAGIREFVNVKTVWVV